MDPFLTLNSQMFDIAEGLDYLHTQRPTIVHADLKGVNVLISSTGRACLADFGLSTTIDATGMNTTTTNRTAGGTLRWQGMF